MTGLMKPGYYRIIQKCGGKTEVLFFRVRHNSDGYFVIEQLNHVGGQAISIKNSEELLTAKMWKKLQFWQ